jgi:hypothetical protein
MKKKIKEISQSLCVLMFCWFSALPIYSCASGGDSTASTTDDGSASTTTINPAAGMDLYGMISDGNNNPIAGVVVSDGYQCVKTDAKGIYQMKRNAAARFVYYSIPPEYKVNVHSQTDNTADFYSPLSASTKRYDFKLTKLANGAESNFTLIAIGDPQVSNRTSDWYFSADGMKYTSAEFSNLWRFKNETMADIKSTLSTISTPVYGISMGDDVDTGAYSLQTSVRNAIGAANMITYSVIGNHDHYGTTSTYDDIGVKAYESAWGPTNFSFNRGNVHFVVMDDVYFYDKTDLSAYEGGFSEAQVEWLKQDLSYVPKSKMVILSYHIPLRNTSTLPHRDDVLSLLSGYASTALFCGHTHYEEVGDITTSLTTTEHVHAAACGAWWKSDINTEGTPNGYQVYTINDTKFTNWYYKSTFRPKDYQIRLSEADCMYGGTAGNTYYDYADQLSLTANAGYVVANVFDADSKWTVMAYENGSTNGVKMTLGKYASDAYALGYHAGVVGKNPTNYGGTNKHVYYYKRMDPNAVVKVVATDEFGNTYTSNTFTKDFTEAMHY